MLITVDTNKLMFQTLETYLSDNVWNLPLTEYRRNITLRAVSKGRSCINTVNLGCAYTNLPYSSEHYDSNNTLIKKAYYVYAAAKCCMGGLIVDVEQNTIKEQLADKYIDGWLPLDEYLNVRPFDLRIHSIFGEWLYRNEIMIKNHPYEDMFLIAIEKKMAKHILGDDYNFFDMYMSVYYDSDNDLQNLRETSPRISCYHITNGATMQRAWDSYATLTDFEKSQTMLFIDGRESVPAAMQDLKIGQYFEVIHDPDIICDIVMDLTDPDENNIYRSVIDNTYKYIVHISKEYNPNSYIITHNTCDIFIRPKTNVISYRDARLHGLFVHRFNTSITDGDDLIDHKITQITHNDFGVSEKLLQPYMEHINSSECYIRVVIRRHSKARKLREDANFINRLYSFDDTTIIQMLTGHGPSTLSFWRADRLEQTEFAKMMTSVPDNISQANVNKYVHALGYYNTLSILTPKVCRVVIEPTNDSNKFDVSVPISMLSCKRINAIVTINGIQLDSSLYTAIKHEQYVTVELEESTSVSTNDMVVVELFEDAPLKAEYFIPSADNSLFVVDEDYEIFGVNRNVIPEEGYFTDNYLQGTYTSYSKVEDTSIILLSEVEDAILYRITPDLEVHSRKKYYTKESTETGVTYTVDNTLSVGDILPENTYYEQYIQPGKTLYFSSNYFGKEFLICSKRVFAAFNNNDIVLGGGVASLETLEYEHGTTSDLLHSGKLELLATKWSNDEQLTIPIISDHLNVVTFLNGKELVPGIDFLFKPIYDSNHNIIFNNIFFSNVSYLKNDTNRFNIFITSDQIFMSYYGFVNATFDIVDNVPIYQYAKIEEINPYVFWFQDLCKSAVDGITNYNLKTSDSALYVTGAARQCGLYYTRGMIPLESMEFINDIISSENDISKLTAITEYIRSISPEKPHQIVDIPYSHHIASTTMAMVVKDVLTKRVRLNYANDPKAMLDQLTQYMSMLKYDPALSGIITDLTIYGAGRTIVNNTYTIFDSTAKGLNRKWVNNAIRMCVWWNCNNHRWEIKSTIATQLNNVYYYAIDEDGSHDPWDLEWTSDVETENMPKFQEGMIDLRCIDLFPSYSSDLHTVMDDRILRQAIKALFPTDSTRDGDTVR